MAKMLSSEEVQKLENQAKAIRRHVLHMTHRSGSSHVGSCFSIVEALTILFFKLLNVDPKNPQKAYRDYFLLSKAHASAALYATLAEKGFYSKEILDRYYVDGGLLPGHLDQKAVPGLENTGGSLGHALSLGSGIAHSLKLEGRNSQKVYVLLGDGECNEGSVWEAAMLASHLKLSNLCVLVDFNKIQSYGNTHDVIDQRALAERWAAFGFETQNIEKGHDFTLLHNALQAKSDRPQALILHTVKGKGVSFMENQLAWHYKSPSDAQLKQALEELGAGT